MLVLGKRSFVQVSPNKQRFLLYLVYKNKTNTLNHFWSVLWWLMP